MKSIQALVALGEQVLSEHGEAACLAGYGTVDPEWVARYALQYGDVNADGTSN